LKDIGIIALSGQYPDIPYGFIKMKRPINL